jgi:hypothetical protein
MKWRAKCRCWTVGDKLHSTDNHKRGGKTQDGALKLGAATLEDVEEEEVKESDTHGALKLGATNIEDVGDDFFQMASGFLMAAKTHETDDREKPQSDNSEERRWCTYHGQWCKRNELWKCTVELGKGLAGRN